MNTSLQNASSRFLAIVEPKDDREDRVLSSLATYLLDQNVIFGYAYLEPNYTDALISAQRLLTSHNPHKMVIVQFQDGLKKPVLTTSRDNKKVSNQKAKDLFANNHGQIVFGLEEDLFEDIDFEEDIVNLDQEPINVEQAGQENFAETLSHDLMGSTDIMVLKVSHNPINVLVAKMLTIN